MQSSPAPLPALLPVYEREKLDAEMLLDKAAYGECLLKNWRRVATRYDKTKESYLGFVAIAAVKLWIPFAQEA